MLSRLQDWFEIGHSGHRNIRSMEGLRGFAVFLVFLVHYVTLIEPWLSQESVALILANYLRGIGNAGVDLFFVLSGYLIYGTLIVKERSFIPYIKRRIQRIYPAFLVMLAFYLVLSFVVLHESKIPSGIGNATMFIVANLLLLPGLFPIQPIITVAWSLSYEMFYYLIVPMLIAALGLRRRLPLFRIGLFLAVACLGLVFAHWVGSSHVRLIMFVSGILLFETLRAFNSPKIDRLGLFALIAGLVVFEQITGPVRYLALFIGYFLLCYAAFHGGGLTTRIFCWTPLRWLGNMSYSYYLMHGLILKAAFLLIGKLAPATGTWGGLAFIGLLLPIFALTVVFSSVLFLFVERPYSLVLRKR